MFYLDLSYQNIKKLKEQQNYKLVLPFKGVKVGIPGGSIGCFLSHWTDKRLPNVIACFITIYKGYRRCDRLSSSCQRAVNPPRHDTMLAELWVKCWACTYRSSRRKNKPSYISIEVTLKLGTKENIWNRMVSATDRGGGEIVFIENINNSNI
jgi:hypothetical protein